MVSVCGATDLPTTLGVDPVKFAQAVAAWAIQFDMDGVDVDYEVIYFVFFFFINA